MGHGHSNIGHSTEVMNLQTKGKDTHIEDFVLEKSIFSNVFEKDIRRVFIYKKAERLAKAIHLITPAFAESLSLRNRIDSIAIGLVDAAILPSGTARTALSRELLALSSVLGIARTGGLLSSMNAELIAREAHILLQEVATYEEPRLFLDDVPTLSKIAKLQNSNQKEKEPKQIKDTKSVKDRRDSIMSVIKNKGTASIKDISTLIRNVSEKTIQRELLSLIEAGMVLKQGERRWSTYSIA
ncbi:MAG: hypothetical protein Q8P23_01350 [bacterium]|nr:hypothetical protein [bacterium]